MRPYLEKSHHKKGLAEWLKIQALSSCPSTTKKKKKAIYMFNAIPIKIPTNSSQRLENLP
jgi:hypothetical protein